MKICKRKDCLAHEGRPCAVGLISKAWCPEYLEGQQVSGEKLSDLAVGVIALVGLGFEIYAHYKGKVIVDRLNMDQAIQRWENEGDR